MSNSGCNLFKNVLLVSSVCFAVSAHAEASTTQAPSGPGAAGAHTAAVLRFGVQGSDNHDVSTLSMKSCTVAPPAAPSTPANAQPDAQATQPPEPIQVDPMILDALSQKMSDRLSTKMAPVAVDPAESAIPVGAMVISGCITRANPGNARARLIGMGVGASDLSVHVIALHRTSDGFQAFDDFALEVKGEDILPPIGPIGLAVHAHMDRQQTLEADANRLAGKILRKIARDEKAKQTP
jgi:hypothetical protein